MFVFVLSVISLLVLLIFSYANNTSNLYWRIGFHQDLIVFSIRIDCLYKYLLVLYFVLLMNIAITHIRFYSEKYMRDFFRMENVIKYKRVYLIYIMYVSLFFKFILIAVLYSLCKSQFDLLIITICVQTIHILLYGVYHLKSKKYNKNEYEQMLSVFDMIEN
jgi:hypothetical protein